MLFRNNLEWYILLYQKYLYTFAALKQETIDKS